ncbi:hypothetical protein HDU93_002968 [Gonapodya sp. JEL0774]|nr:hypothetical protein HDU93_002968 [Gonapodya sp. JEL0774]
MAVYVHARLEIKGMTCSSCSSSIKSALKELAASRSDLAAVSDLSVIPSVEVDHSSGDGEVVFLRSNNDQMVLALADIVAAVEDAGFDVTATSDELTTVESGLPTSKDSLESSTGEMLNTATSFPPAIPAPASLSSQTPPGTSASGSSTSSTPSASCVLRVGGMTCGSCVSSVAKALKDGNGVGEVSVALLTEKAQVTYNPSIITPAQLIDLIECAGFDAEAISISLADPPIIPSTTRSANCVLSIQGMTCASCVGAVTKGLKSREGVSDAKVALLAERAQIDYDPSFVTPTDLVSLVRSLGFDASIILATGATSSEVSSSQRLPNRDQTPRVYTFEISDLVNPSCTSSVEEAVKRLQGVKECHVSINAKSARVVVLPDNKAAGVRDISEAIEAAGFHVLQCGDGATPTRKDFRDSQVESLSRSREIANWWGTFAWSAALSAVLMALSMVIPMWGPSVLRDVIRTSAVGDATVGDFTQFVLSSIVLFGVGRSFFVRAWKSLGKGATMDVLVVVGTTAAYSFSTYMLTLAAFSLSHSTSKPTTYFETPAMLITFVSLGRYLENLAKGRTSTALAALLELSPSTATLLLLDEQGHVTGERFVSATLVQKNDLVRVKPGEKFPADGFVVEGSSYVDESMISGEPVPVRKLVGSPIIGGTVNGAGSLDIRVMRVGGDAMLAQIVRLVEEAQMARAPVQDLADRVAGIFVPVVLGLGAATFFLWMVLFAAAPHLHSLFSDQDTIFTLCLKLGISTVVIACPCALGLAVPTAVMVGTGVGAQMGILIKGGASLEAASKIDTVVFDKTGTLTKGKMEVCDTLIVGRDDLVLGSKPEAQTFDRAVFWQCLWAAESRSEHPMGKAITHKALEELYLSSGEVSIDEAERAKCLAEIERNMKAEVEDFVAEAGKGIRAVIRLRDVASLPRHRILIGNTTFLEAERVPLPPGLASVVLQHSRRARTVSLIAIDSQFTGLVAVSDQPKSEARTTISQLRRMGMRVAMVTGDARATALAVAETVGLFPEEVHASATPQDKEVIVTKLQSASATGNRRYVAFIGDGINDSVAISRADLGIAVGAGTDVAIEAAQVVLIRDDLSDVVTAIDLSQTIFRRIQLNFIFSTLYNGVTIPLAMGCLVPIGFIMPPMAAGAAMAASSVSVVVSSLMLKAYRRPGDHGAGWLERQRLGVPVFSNSSKYTPLAQDIEAHMSASADSESFLPPILTRMWRAIWPVTRQGAQSHGELEMGLRGNNFFAQMSRIGAPATNYQLLEDVDVESDGEGEEGAFI